jgi:hypothetical protein
MRSNDVEYWDEKPDITEEVYKYSETFVHRFDGSNRRLDYSEESLIREISNEIDNYNEWDLTQTKARVYWAQVLAYFSTTLCKIFDGNCVGEFWKNNPGGSYYTFRVRLKGKYYNSEAVMARACDQQFNIVDWYKNLKKSLLYEKVKQ